MTLKELAQKRAELWRLRPLLAPNSEKEIREFLKLAGFCYTYYIARDTIPSITQTISGTHTPKKHFRFSHNDPFREMLDETFHAYSKQKLFVEVGIFGKHPVIVYRDVFALLYRIAGKKVRGGYIKRRKRNTNIEKDILFYLDEMGPAGRREIRASVFSNRRQNPGILTKVLESLSRQLKIIRTRRSHDAGITWITPEVWNPHLCEEATKIDLSEAIENLIIRFLRISVASSRKSLKRFFQYSIPSDIMDYHLNSLLQRGIIITDPELILRGKRALKIR
jgi:hypothetical protein